MSQERLGSKELDKASLAYRGAVLLFRSLYGHGIDRDFPFKLTVSGAENLPRDNPYLLAFTHHNSWDIPVIGTTVYKHTHRPINFWTAEELLDESKFTGRLLNAMHAIPINREEPTRDQLRTAYGILEEGGILGVSTEGEIIDGDRIAAIKAGPARLAIKYEVDIVPVAVAGPNQRRPWGKDKGKRMPFIPRGAHVDIAQPITTWGLSGAHAKKNAEEINKLILRAQQRGLDKAYQEFEKGHRHFAAGRLDRST